ncbi:serine/threonine-protein kinase [Marinicella meishanensis]|uniref:serine/threonine-protein kinase n=1 Tax=Marinicella meishanensis TaxID=2873263 RepID=UPI001CBAC230|nr:serine/threonine-protein kinase [Marinicella sp. NBU2979]
MTLDLMQQAQQVFEQLLTLEDHEMTAWLQQECGADEALLQTVLTLLNSHQQLADERTVTIEHHILRLLHTQADGRNIVAPAELTFNHDRYRIIEKIGDGGMGSVYLCERTHEGFTEQVAIKVLHGLDIHAAEHKRFIQEKHILAQLNHPNITHFIDTDYLADGTPFVVMAYTPGMDITKHCQGHKTKDKLDLFLQLCEAVKHAHQNLIIHRDIKPSNVLVTDSGEVKLIDFGIAKILSKHNQFKTQTQLAVMTPAYASPEQLQKKPLNTTTDIYSMGVLLYELLAGSRPHDLQRLSMGQFEAKVTKGDLQLPSLRAQQAGIALDRDLDAIILKAMQVKPSERYQSVQEFIDDIDRYLQNKPVLARKPNWLYRSQKFCQRNWLPLSVVGVFVLVSAWFAQQIHQANQQSRLEQQKAQVLSDSFIMAFKNADPTQTLGEAIKATDILDQATQLITQQYADQPALLNDLSLAMAEVHHHLGAFAQAQNMVDLAINNSSADNRSDWQFLQAKILFSTNDLDALLALLPKIDTTSAEQQLRKDMLQLNAWSRKGLSDDATELALRLMQQAQPTDPHFTELCLIHYDLYFHDKPKALQFSELDQCLVELDQSDENLLKNSQVYMQFAALHRSHNEFEQSTEYFKKALAINQRVYGDRHISLVGPLKGIGWNTMQYNDYAASIEYQNQALAISEKYFGVGHPNTSNAIYNLGHVYSNMEDYDQAFALYNRAIQIMVDNGLGEERKVAFYYKAIGHLQNDLGYYEAAERNIKNSIHVFGLLQGLYVYRVAEMQVLLAHIHHNQGRDDEALALLQTAMPNMYTMHEDGEYYQELGERLLAELSTQSGS